MSLLAVLALSLSTASVPPLAPGECVVLAPLNGAEVVFGGDECARRTLPASTFKIPHALIALEAGVVTDTSVIKWDGTKRDYDVWNRDQTLDSSIKMSAVWVFQQFAAAIGRDRELSQLRAFRYGSATFEHEVTSFWLNGDLQISPREEVAFLRRMYSYDLPVARRHIDTVKAAMTMPRGKILSAAGAFDFPLQWPDAVVRAKTGNGTVNGERASWLIGEIETGGRQYVFASRATGATLVNNAGAALALRVLNTIDPASLAQGGSSRGHSLIELWSQGKPAFGAFFSISKAATTRRRSR
jgi:beta-lactamase class D